MSRRGDCASAFATQRGVLLVEVLVGLLLCALGIVGFARLQSRTSEIEFETLQRVQALSLLDDMVSRINNNRSHADDYVSAGLIGSGAVASCGSLGGAALDLCEWGNLIRGVSESRGSRLMGSMLVARGCIARAADTSNRYTVSVAWQGLVATGAPAAPCGAGDTSYSGEALRRVVSSTVCIARLRDPALPPSLARC